MLSCLLAYRKNDITGGKFTLRAILAAIPPILSNALIIPFDVSGGYTASFLNPFEAGYAPYGVTSQRYKYQHILEKPLNTEQFNAAYAQWQKDRAQAAGN